MCNFAVRKFRDMYAIVEIAGQQFKVTNGQEIYVNRLQGEEGSKVSFDRVLLIDNEGTTQVGAPTVAGANVEATIKEHCKGKKVIVFKKKRLSDLERPSPVPEQGRDRQHRNVKPEKTEKIWHTRKASVVPRTVVSQQANDLE